MGNTLYRSSDNTKGHYQDNRVQYFLQEGSRQHIIDYKNAGVLGILFGRGASGQSGYLDSEKDGITNPPPINGNDLMAEYPDDDGGFARLSARAYYAQGPVPLGPPKITGTAASPSPTEVTITWATDVPATSQVDYGITSGLGVLTQPDTQLVTSHSVTISGLTPETTYRFQVRSADASGEEAIEPDPPASFTTLRQPVAGVCGDQNDDGVVNTTDVTIDLQIAVGLLQPTPRHLILGDLNRDRLVDVADAVMSLQYMLGLLAVISCGHATV